MFSPNKGTTPKTRSNIMIIDKITSELTLFLILSLLFILYNVSEAFIIAYVPFEARKKAIKLDIPIFVSKPLPEMTSIIIVLTCSGIKLFTNFVTMSIDISNDAAINTIIVNSGIIAKIILKAIFDGNIAISGFSNILNNVKYINDNYGHEEGDEVIKKAASILIINQQENTDIVRTDGNEFLIYMVGYDEKKVIEYTRKINKELKELPHGFGATLGYSMIEDDIKTIDDAINEATLSMRQAKEKI